MPARACKPIRSDVLANPNGISQASAMLATVLLVLDDRGALL
jgi:hypothetical protein